MWIKNIFNWVLSNGGEKKDSKKKPGQRHRRLQIESLESRQLLSVTPYEAGLDGENVSQHVFSNSPDVTLTPTISLPANDSSQKSFGNLEQRNSIENSLHGSMENNIIDNAPIPVSIQQSASILPTENFTPEALFSSSDNSDLRITSVVIDDYTVGSIYEAQATYDWAQFNEVTSYRPQYNIIGESSTDWQSKDQITKKRTAGLSFNSAGDTIGFRVKVGETYSEQIYITAGSGRNSNTLTIDMASPTQGRNVSVQSSFAWAKYQWYRGTSQTAVNIVIDGATGASYQPDARDVGCYLKCVVTLSNSYAASSCTIISSKQVIGSSVAKVNITDCAISGIPQVNSVLTANVTPSSATCNYQWFRCTSLTDTGQIITNATNKTYTVSSADVGSYLRCIARGSNSYAGAKSAYTASTVKSSSSSSTPLTSMTLSTSSPKVGTSIQASASPSSVAATYQWYRRTSTGSFTAISGATSSTYTPSPNDVNYYLQCIASGSSNQITSATIGPVTAVNNKPDLAVYKQDSWSDIIVVNGNQTSRTDSAVSTNGDIYAHVSFANLGNSDITDNFTIAVFLDNKQIRNYVFDTGFESGKIGSYYFDLNRDINQNSKPISAGKHTIKVVLDYNEEIAETNGANNTYERTFVVSTPPAFDLKTYDTAMLSKTSVHKGDLVRISDITIENTGNMNSGNYSISYYASTNTVISTTDYYLGSNLNRTSLEAGRSAGATYDFSTSELPVGTYYIGWIITSNNTESNTSNNTGYCTDSLIVENEPRKNSAPTFYLYSTESGTVQMDIIPSGTVAGYELQFSVYSSFPNSYTTTRTYSDAVGTKTIYSLSTGTRYYFRLRALGVSSAYNSDYTCKEIVVEGIPTGYNTNDYSKIRSFLDSNGNGLKLNSSYDLTNPTTWKGVVWTSDSVKRIKELNWFDKGLSGNLDVSGFTSLEKLECTHGNVKSVNLKNAGSLKTLYIAYTDISEINVSENTNLETLYLTSNDLSSIDISRNTKLKKFDCTNNSITSLDISNNTLLGTLGCEFCQLTKLEVTNCTLLEDLYCSGNKLTDLDLSNCSNLSDLYCEDNEFSYIDLTHNHLITNLKFWGEYLKGVYLDSSVIDNLEISFKGIQNMNWTFRNINGTIVGSMTNADIYPCYSIHELPVIVSNAAGTSTITFQDPKVLFYDLVFDQSTSGIIPDSIVYGGICALSTPVISNTGTGESDGYEVEFYASPSISTLFNINNYLGSTFKGSLMAGESDIASYQFNAAEKLSTGSTYYFGWKIVSDNDNNPDNNSNYYSYSRTVQKAPLSIAAKDNSITYGSSPTANGYTVSGFVNGDSVSSLAGSISYSYDYSRYGNVGTYTITPSGFSSSNYAITYVPGDLTVNKKSVTLSSATISKVYDGTTSLSLSQISSPVFSGTVNGDSLGLSAVTGSYSSSSVGARTVTITGATLSGTKAGNYSFSQSAISGTIYAQQLSTPTLNQPEASGTTVSCSWSSVANASSYSLEYKLSTASSWTTKSVSGTSTTFTGVAGSTYNVRVKAIGSGNYSDSAYSASKSVVLVANPFAGYNAAECTQLQAFLEQTNSSGVRNGTKLNSAYSSTDPTTWTGVTWETVDGVKRVTKLGLNESWRGKGLSGSLDVSNCISLTYLYCGSNQLTSLDVSKNTALTELYCDSNQLMSLDVSKNTALEWLYCSSNELTELDVSNNTALKYLECDFNELTELDVSKNTSLKEFICDSNNLLALDVSTNTLLTVLSCHSNELTSLDVSKNTELMVLICYSNELTSLGLSNCTALTHLDCWNGGLQIVQMSSGAIGKTRIFPYSGSNTTWTFKNSAGTTVGTITEFNSFTVSELPLYATSVAGAQTISFVDVNAALPLSTPTLNTPAASGTTVSCTWSSVANASGYTLEYKLSTASSWTTKSVSGTSTTFTGGAGSTYDVRVMAVGTGSYSDSEYSAEKQVTLNSDSTKVQRVYTDSTTLTGIAGGSLTLPVMYTSLDNIANLTGLGLQIHYDSSVLEYTGFANQLQASKVGAPQDNLDSSDNDNDASTDRKVVVAWSDMDAKWPGQTLPVKLLDAMFKVKDGVTASSTEIHFTASSTTPGYTFQSEATTVRLISGSLDVDGNGEIDLLSDGLLLKRYLAGYTGDALTRLAIGVGATRTTAEQITEYLNRVGTSVFDIDHNGQLDLLTDGMLMTRYLAGYTGESLTRMAIGAGATRTTSEQIVSYIQSMTPTSAAPTAAPVVAQAYQAPVAVQAYQAPVAAQAVSVPVQQTISTPIFRPVNSFVKIQPVLQSSARFNRADALAVSSSSSRLSNSGLQPQVWSQETDRLNDDVVEELSKSVFSAKMQPVLQSSARFNRTITPVVSSSSSRRLGSGLQPQVWNQETDWINGAVVQELSSSVLKSTLPERPWNQKKLS